MFQLISLLCDFSSYLTFFIEICFNGVVYLIFEKIILIHLYFVLIIFMDELYFLKLKIFIFK